MPKANTHPIRVTLFPDEYARTLETKTLTLPELRSLIVSASATRKSGLKLLKLAKFGDQPSKNACLRHNDNVRAIFGIETDYDDEQMSFDAAVATIKQVRLSALVYTSPSHTPDKPRWRVLLPTSDSWSPATRDRLVARVNGVLGGILAPESFVLSQAYYYGRVNGSPQHRCEVINGDFINLRHDLDAGAIYPGGNTEPHEPANNLLADDPALVVAWLSIIPNKDIGWEDWNRVGMATFAATDGSSDGLAAFRAWSRKSGKYNERNTAAKWMLLAKSPPKRIGAGSLYHLANEAWPGWEDDPQADKVIAAFARAVEDDTKPARSPQPQTEAERPQTEPPAAGEHEPLDLWASFNPTELPRGLLPKTIELFAREESAIMGADPAGLAMGALTVCAAALPDRIKVQVKEFSEGWQESARIWTALIGDPSSKKSPILRRVARPLIRIDARLYQQYLAAQEAYDALPSDEKKEAPQPRQQRIRIEDTTIEAAQLVLADSPDGVLCLQDELSGWFGMMDKYAGNRGAAKDRSFWLSSFNGGQYVWNRIGRGSGIIENMSVSMLGGIQPAVMRKVADATVDDGALQRLFTIMLRPAAIGRDTPDTAGRHYDELVDKLHQLPPNEYVDIILRFDDGAQAVRRRLEQTHLDLMAAWEVVHKKLAAHIGKYDGLFARLCVLWHCIEHADGEPPPEITESTALRVEAFLHGFLLRHAFVFYTDMLGLADDHDRLAAIAGYILTRKLERITVRDIQRGDRTMRKLTRRDTDQMFEQLEAFGWLIRKEGKRPGATIWEVNPRVHVLFRERAATEEARRQTIRKIMASLGRAR